MLLLLHAAGKAEALARSYAELSFRARQMLMAFIVEVVESQAGSCFSTLATTTKLVPCRGLGRQSPVGKPPTGEPDALCGEVGYVVKLPQGTVFSARG